jgi:peptidoglycan/xylan/chitin deacetylase (PgdA/CDA1 family)
VFNRLRKASEWVRRCTPRGLILMYHRVAEKDVDPWSLSVTPEHFAEHLAVLRRHAFPVSLLRLSQAHRECTFPDRAVALTFDDGYANNLYNARPLLERADIPATVFIATGYNGSSEEFWWDALDQALLRPGRLPATLELNLHGLAYRWELGEAAEYSESQHRQDFTRYAADAPPGSRLAFYCSVWEKLQRLPAKEQQRALDMPAGHSPDTPLAAAG